MASRPTPGAQANWNGSNWELDILDRLKRHNYTQWSQPPTLLSNQPYFIRGYKSRFCNPYGEEMTLDFYVYHPQKYQHGLIIDCKYQQAGGSVDEKLYFSVAALKRTGIPAILMIGGSAFRDSAIDYCKSQQDRFLLVLTDWNDLILMFNTGQI